MGLRFRPESRALAVPVTSPPKRSVARLSEPRHARERSSARMPPCVGHTAHPQFGGQAHTSQPHALPQQQRAASPRAEPLVVRHAQVVA